MGHAKSRSCTFQQAWRLGVAANKSNLLLGQRKAQESLGKVPSNSSPRHGDSSCRSCAPQTAECSGHTEIHLPMGVWQELLIFPLGSLPTAQVLLVPTSKSLKHLKASPKMSDLTGKTAEAVGMGDTEHGELELAQPAASAFRSSALHSPTPTPRWGDVRCVLASLFSKLCCLVLHTPVS